MVWVTSSAQASDPPPEGDPADQDCSYQVISSARGALQKVTSPNRGL